MSTTNTNWGGGYVTDIEYIEGFYAQQSPTHLSLSCLLRGVTVPMPGPDDPVSYLELGCGHGVGALILAASNPAWRVTAIDYNPAHIASARAMAAAAGVGNISFLEADLGSLAGSAAARAVPEADFTSLHGVWTWVAPEVRQGIVRLLAEKVRPGGVVHVSYNALPAWQGMLGMQRLILEAGRRGGWRSDARTAAGLGFARELNEAGAHYLQTSPLAQHLLTATKDQAAEYVTHEYMNEHWAPAFHADVAAAMAGAKLDWVSTASLLESFPQLMLTEPQRELYERHDDPAMRELVMDTCVQRQFRHDVYVRGARRMLAGERDTHLSALSVTPIVAPSEMDTSLSVPAGKAEMGPGLQWIIADALQGPATIGELLSRQPGVSNPAELTAILVSTGQAQPVLRPAAEQAPAASRLNRLLGGRVRSMLGQSGAAGLASSQLGTGLVAPRLIQFIAGRLLAGEREDNSAHWTAELSRDLDDTAREELATLIRTAIERRVPVLRRLGIVPP
ncbi:class I SAM-dependent methyltransferase [Roseomonas xinghualingensis]|uniref:class I SAM-dependent methyltransferase n=1 Tax=Roseomonas xinghualingensis TaxID=2986475 RepID=UPI0021F1B725|nr:class I SAM-dependent methyltransferase [Roseomonas sp. SXEYE001]MCV4209665.1 class I SAM-dependent methyltransferase [Roseomonas sp. SXEYE001]